MTRPVLLVGLLGLTLTVIGGVLLVVPQRGVTDTAESKQVVARATDFAVAYNTYDAADVDAYQDRVRPLLTAEFDAEYVEITQALFDAIADKKQKSGDADVKQVAVESMDGDSAEVMVVVDATVTNTDNEGEVLRQFRWMVSMSREGGEWKVASFQSVGAEPAGGEDGGTVDPSAVPTEPAPTDASPSPSPSEGSGE